MAATAAAACPDAGGEPVRVSEVVAGNIARLEDGRVIRLAGIDVPAPSLDPDAAPPLVEAARAAFAALAAGRSAMLIPAGKGQPDRHGRVPGSLRLADGRTAQESLIAAGLARARWLPGEGECFAALHESEKAAESGGLGVWRSPDYATRDAEDAASLLSRIGLYELVEGRILSVGHGSRMIFLDFGRDIRRDFTVMVPPPVAEGLAAAGIVVDDLAGRRVRVRGVIEESGGPAIRLNDAVEIEVFD